MTSIGSMGLRDVEFAEPVVGHVVIAVDYCGICGTDLHGIAGVNGRREPGQVMGHEAAGRILAVGRGVTIPVGAAVTFNPLLSCGQCEHCRDGEDQRCDERRVIGVDVELDGAFSEFVTVPASAVHVLPADMDVRFGALVEPIAVALHAIRVAGDVVGKRVLILGGGPIGQSAVLVARSLGAAEVFVSEPVAERRAICSQLGAVAVRPDLLADALEVSLPDVVIDAVGVSQSVHAGLALLRAGGTLVLVGMGSPNLDVAAYAVTVGERSVRGSYCYNRRDFADAVEIAGSHREVLELLISEVTSLQAASQTIDRLLTTTPLPGKVMISFTEGTSPRVMS